LKLLGKICQFNELERFGAGADGARPMPWGILSEAI
jgi:hypothetical protein